MIDVDRLIESHVALHNGNRGKKGLGHITRSAVVILAATWENYIESLLNESLKYICNNLEFPKQLPKVVQKSFANKIRKDKNEQKALHLAGDGWKQVIQGYARQETDLLHSPKSQQVDLLFKNYTGYKNFSKDWDDLGIKLDAFLSKRGEIAHKGRQAKYIKMSELSVDKEMIECLSINIDGLIADYLKATIQGNRLPWNKVV